MYTQRPTESPHLAQFRRVQQRYNGPSAKARAKGVAVLAAYGFILGVLVWTAALRLGIDALPDARAGAITLVAGALGGVLACTRARFLFGLVSGLVTLSLLFIMYVPVTAKWVRGTIRQDPLQPADAVAVLAAETQGDGTLTTRAQARLFHGYELIGGHYAPRLVFTTRLPATRSARESVERQVATLGLKCAVEDAGLAQNTHDEALAISILAARRGWKRLILVSHPLHMRRAAATFTHAGVAVICSPCQEGRYDLADLSQPDDRLDAFRDWLHEQLGYTMYRLRGWL